MKADCTSPIWNAERSDLNPCIEQTVLGIIPFFLIVLCSSFKISGWVQTTQRSFHDFSYSRLSVNEDGDMIGRSIIASTKNNKYKNNDFLIQFVNLIACAWPIAALAFFALNKDSVDIFWYEYVFGILNSLTAIVSMIVFHKSVKLGLGRDGRFLGLFWGLELLLLSVVLYSQVNIASHNGLTFKEVSFFIYFGIVFGLFLCLALKNAPMPTKPTSQGFSSLQEPLLAETQESKNILPEPYAGLFSVLSFSWLNPLMSIGYEKPLQHADLYELSPEDAANVLNSKLRHQWSVELARRGSMPSLTKALFRSFGPMYLVAVFLKWVYDTLMFVGPLILNRLISFLGSQSGNAPEPLLHGIGYIALLFVSSVLQSWVLHQYFHRCYRTGLRLKSSIITIIYQKALRIKPGQTSLKDNTPKQDETSNSKASTGEIVNLMSVDAQRLQELMGYLAILVSAPYQVCVSLALLWGQLGPSIFAGVVVMGVMVPISAAVARQVKALQKKLMKIKDVRIKVTNEVFSGISIIKMYAWEKSYKGKIEDLRKDELHQLRSYLLINCVSRVLWTIVPVLVTLATFATYILLGHNLDAAKAFTAIALFNILRFPLAFFPIMISNSMEASLSIDRITQFLRLPEIDELPCLGPAAIAGLKDERAGSGLQTTNTGVFAASATLNWDDNTPLLDNVSMVVPQGSLTCVIGMTGSGKSGLLQALIGDLKPSGGQLAVVGKIAYTSQVAWIQNATLRDNVLFGQPYEPDWYRIVLDACALLPDLDLLPSGDQTEIGERGINLSGGQKQRVSIARALYQRADVYLLDDPLSAVDSHVAKHIFEKCIRGLLKDKAVVLVTHNLHMLPPANKILLLNQKKIEFCGNYEELCKSGLSFADVLSHGEEVMEGEEYSDQEQEATVETKTGSVRQTSVRDPSHSVRKASRQITRQKSKDKETERAQSKIKAQGKDVLVEKEASRQGAVSWKIYLEYIRGCGGYSSFVIAIFTLLLSQLAQVAGNSWLSYWSDNNLNGRKGLTVYGLLALSAAATTMLTLVKFSFAGLSAARYFHAGMLGALIRAPMAFFDTTPVGRILNRFSKDTYTIDEVLMQTMYSYMTTLMAVLFTVGVIGYVTPYFLLAMIPPGFLYYFTQRYYVASSRELQRLDSVSRSPIFSHFSETLDGVSTIRAFRRQLAFVADNERKLDHNLMAYFISTSANRWLAIRLEFVGTCIVTLAALFAVLGRGAISAGLGGLSITYALSITQTLNWMVRMTSECETNVVAVERVQEYITEVDPEAASIVENNRPSSNWPHAGRISLKGVSLRYRPGLPLVLNEISLEISAGEKVGIVGRTGAGKSSLLKALLRLVEPCAGAIFVDDCNILDIGLEDLRSRFSIIPQDPVLFTGTVRFNLDPFSSYTDEQVWESLRRSHLYERIYGLDERLSYQVEEAGRNFSMGERQLLCMSRALLRRSQVLLLDEATSAVDHQTDALIQETIRTEFGRSTVLTIAHRVDTIKDYNRVLVLSNGSIIENNSPAELLKNSQSEFYKIWDAHQKGMSV